MTTRQPDGRTRSPCWAGVGDVATQTLVDFELAMEAAGYVLLWDSDLDQAVDDEVANALIEGRLIGEHCGLVANGGVFRAESDEAHYRIYRGTHIREVFIKPKPEGEKT